MVKKILLLLVVGLICLSNAFSFDNSTLKPEYQSLVAYYELNTNSDDSTGRYNGTDFSFPTYTGSSVDLDGVNDYIISDVFNDSYTGDLTVSLWAYLDDVINQQILFTTDGNNQGATINIESSNTITFQVYDGISRKKTTAPGLSTGTWYHIVGVYKDNNQLELYVDGSNTDNTSVGTVSYFGSPELTLGRQGSTSAFYFNGELKDVSVYYEALDQATISDLYNNVTMFDDLLDSVGVGILVNNPVDEFNYTFDVTTLPINIITSGNASCRYQYQGINTSLSSTDNLEHTGTFNLGSQVNQSLTYDVTFFCQDTVTLDWTSSDITFYRQQEPLNLDIIVPQDQQIFVPSTEEIQFYLETNYVALCKYNVNGAGEVDFTNTNTSIHTTVFQVNSSTLTYNSYFQCDAVNFVESNNKSVTFYLDELVNFGQFSQANVVIEDGFGVINVVVGETADVMSSSDGILGLAVIGAFITFIVTLIGLLGFFIRSTVTKSMGKLK